MKRMILLLVASFFLSMTARADNFQPVEIISRMKKAADWQLGNPFGVGELAWHCAPFYMGLSDLSGISGDRKYIDAAKAIGERNGWKLGKRKYHADDHAVGQVYLKLYQRDTEPRMIAPLKERFDWILANPPKQEYDVTWKNKDGITKKSHNVNRWSWCDALYMAPPVWAGLSKVTGEQKYLDHMVKEWKQTTDWLWDDEAGLFYRDKNYIGRMTPDGKKIFWARGDGWVFAGLAQMLKYLPAHHPDRPFFEEKFRRIAATLKAIQKDNGTWAPSLLDPEHIPQDETSGTAFFTYGMAWGINNGLLDRAACEGVARKGWKALCERQKENGRLINVQPVGASPVGFDPNSTVIYGMGAFISAGSEVYKMVGGNMPAGKMAPKNTVVTFMKDGGWCWYQDPRAVIHNGILFIGAVKGNGTGPALVGIYDLKEEKLLGTVLMQDNFGHDDHNSPVFHVRPDGSVLATYAKHNREKFHYSRISDSSDPLKWSKEVKHERTSPNPKDRVTYMNLYEMKKEELLYNFYRGINFNPTFVTSSDHGKTWSKPVHFFKNELHGRQRPYARYAGNGEDTVYVSVTDGHPRAYGNSIYYFEFRGGKYYKADGTLIKELKDGPLLPSQAELVFKGSGTRVKPAGYESMPTNAWTSSIAIDADGHPYIGYSLYLNNTDHRYRIASWNGKKWIDREVAFAGKCLYTRESSYTGLITLDPTDPTSVYISSDVDPASGKDCDGKHEIYTAKVGPKDNVKTIQWKAVTTNSNHRNIRPVVVSGSGYKVLLWLSGPWNTYRDYNSDVVGIVLEKPLF